MRRYKRILVVTSGRDGCKRSAEVAGDLAQRNGSSVRLLNVLRPFPRYARFAEPDVDAEELAESVRRTRLEDLEHAADTIRERGCHVTADVLWGTPFIEIIRAVGRDGHDLVIKDAESEKSLSNALFGSLDLHLLRKCPCPLWLLKPNRAPDARSILAAVDVEAETEEGRSLNRLILELSTSLASVEGSTLHVAHCWRVPGAGLLERRTPSEKLERYRSEIFGRVFRLFDSLLTEFAEHVAMERRHLIEGDPSEQLPRLAREHTVNLIVMGTAARSGVPGLFIGNTAERVLGQVDCDVLTAKPAGFVSPVTLPVTQSPAPE